MGLLSGIIHGPPGQTWTNTTNVTYWVLRVAGQNTCGRCWALDGKLSPTPWPIPMHWFCRCMQFPLAPGATTTTPFPSYRDSLENLPLDQRVKVVGRSTYALIRAGLIDWDDVVLADRVRSLAEVLDLFRISEARAIAAGVGPAVAGRASSVPSATEAVWVARAARSIEEMLRDAAGPGGAYGGLVGVLDAAVRRRAKPGPPPKPATIPTPEARQAQLDDLAFLLSGKRTRRLTPEERAIVERELGEPAARSVDAFLAAVDGRKRAGGTIGAAVAEIERKYRGR